MDFLKPIKNDIDYKLLVLLALDSIGELSKEELDSILIKGDYSDYFSNTLAVSDLLSQNSIKLNDIYYDITEKGRSELRLFINRIPSSIRSRFLINSLQYKKELLKDRDINLNFEIDSDDNVTATLFIYSQSYELIKIKLKTSEDDINYNCLNKIRRNKKFVYENIINLAFIIQNDNDDKISKLTNAVSDIKYIDYQPYALLKYNDNVAQWEIRILIPSPDMAEGVCTAWEFKAESITALIYKRFFAK